MGEQLDSSPLGQVSIQDELNYTHKKIINQLNIAILSHQDSLRNVMKECLVNDKLKPYSTGSDCHLDDITYALVNANIDMFNLEPSQKPSLAVYYSFRLKQSTKTATMSTNNE
eukprot:3796194-Ditylum_brightwellii.AAC.1